MPYVYSTMTNSNKFVKYSENASSPHAIAVKSVLIKGGHGLKNPKGLDTPMGVVTQVSDADMEFLKADPRFQKLLKAGFVSIDTKKIEPEKKAKNMELRDGSAPLTPDNYAKGERAEDAYKVKREGTL